MHTNLEALVSKGLIWGILQTDRHTCVCTHTPVKIVSQSLPMLNAHVTIRELKFQFFTLVLALEDPFFTYILNSFIDITYHMLLLLFSNWVMSNYLQPHELQHTRLPCLSLSSRTCSNSRPLCWWCHPTVSSFDISCSFPQSFQASGTFPMSRLFTSGGQSIRASASGSVPCDSLI